ncbi:SDR family oxidoreductase [Argonema antarcticum]|uniref:SDR family oxidoreductase n=1 Tax=Argonema antarcticum TaxID=2942763 RepID=UPI002010DF47|nr:SDR family oxidoreductase [Argonema antarcticum]MCL1472723.1 SDR family oxidoreductase [Argonema antarcticum A004/B2]
MSKIILITGATSGIGKETAKALARTDSTVVIVGRHEQKTQNATHEIKEFSGNSNIDYFITDLSLMSEVIKLAHQFKERYSRLDTLINNAGVFLPEKIMTQENMETTFATNYLSPFLLTNLLIEHLQLSPQGRIINVSSGAYEEANLDFENIQAEKSYDGGMVYANSKLEIILFTLKMANILQNTSVTVNSFNPGRVATDLNRLVQTQPNPNDKTPEEGAQTAIYLAISPDVRNINGNYFYLNKPILLSEKALNLEWQDKLWQISNSLINRFI